MLRAKAAWYLKVEMWFCAEMIPVQTKPLNSILFVRRMGKSYLAGLPRKSLAALNLKTPAPKWKERLLKVFTSWEPLLLQKASIWRWIVLMLLSQPQKTRQVFIWKAGRYTRNQPLSRWLPGPRMLLCAAFGLRLAAICKPDPWTWIWTLITIV